MPHTPFPPTLPLLSERFLRGFAPQAPYKERGRPLTPLSSGFGSTLDPRSATRLLWKTLALALLSLLLVSKTSESKPTKDSTPPRYLLHPASLAKRGIDLPVALLPSVKAQDLARTLSLEVSPSRLWLNGQTPFRDSALLPLPLPNRSPSLKKAVSSIMPPSVDVFLRSKPVSPTRNKPPSRLLQTSLSAT